MDECTPLAPGLRLAAILDTYSSQASKQGLTLFHFSAQRKHILWDTSGA